MAINTGTNFFSNLAISPTVDVALTTPTSNGRLAMLAKCTGVPPTTANAFEHGCLMVRTDSGDGNSALYENIGTSSVPSWNLVGAVSPGEITLAEGQILVGNSAGVAAATTNGNVTIKAINDNPAGGTFSIFHDSASPAVSDEPAVFYGAGRNSAAALVRYAGIAVVTSNVTSGAERGYLSFRTTVNGVMTDAARITHNGTNGILGVGDNASTGIIQSIGDFDVILRTGNTTTGSITIADGANGNIDIIPNGTGAVTIGSGSGRVNLEGFISIDGPYSINDTPILYNGNGAVSIDKTRIDVATTAGAVALTLADATVGRVQFYVMTADDGNDVVLTPTNLVNGTTITFNDVGDTALLVFVTGGWAFYGGTATLA